MLFLVFDQDISCFLGSSRLSAAMGGGGAVSCMDAR